MPTEGSLKQKGGLSPVVADQVLALWHVLRDFQEVNLLGIQ